MTPRPASAAQRLRAAATAGDRPYVAAVAVVFTASLVMLSGPLSRYLEGRERVALLERKEAALAEEIGALERRAADLADPRQVELLAREQLGYVKPGEVPYVVVTPEPPRPRLVPGAGEEAPSRSWWQRLWRAVTPGD